MGNLFKQTLNFFFPSVCLHCKALLENSKLFCKGCSAGFELIDPSSRCMYCYAEKGAQNVCFNCIKNKAKTKLGAACDMQDGPATLVSMLKSGQMPYLAKTAAAFMAMQLARLNWPSFDLIVPIPKRLWLQECHHTWLIAKALGSILNLPVNSCLKRLSGGLPRSKIYTNEEMHFYLTKKEFLAGKRVLLVDDVIYSGRTLRHGAYALKELCEEVYGLSFARSPQ